MSWKQLDSRTVYENPWMEVREDHVVNPGGGRNHYGYVHFKNRAIAILPLDDEGNTWLVGQQRYTLGEYSWELPMGGAPLHEDPLAAAQRDVHARWNYYQQLAGLEWTAGEAPVDEQDEQESH